MLVELLHKWNAALDENKIIRVLLLDYSKAFDKVNHNKLIEKLKNLGTPQILINWFTSFLEERTIRTKILIQWKTT